MSKAWDLKVDDKRSANSLFTFIIFCEDEISEYFYFKWFETSLIKVNVIRNQKSMLTNLRKAITFCTQHGILVNRGTNYKLEVEGIELWCVYDRDIENNLSEISEKDNEFNLSISLGEQNDFNVAWSNDAFELWILLHLMDIDTNIEDTKKRIFYYEALTDYFKNKENPNSDLAKAITHNSFSYKKDLKSKNNFINIVRSEILPNTHAAIERSKALFDIHKAKVNHFEKKPCTTVHNLVINLLDKGKQKIPK